MRNLPKKMTVFLPKDHEWDLMSDLSTILSDLSEVTTYMCSEKNVSSEVYPIVCGLLRKRLKVLDSDGNVIRKAKELISEELKGCYQPSDIKAEESLDRLIDEMTLK
jgi:hypothetical protein